MNRLNKTESVISNIVGSLYFARIRFPPDYFNSGHCFCMELVKLLPLHRYSVDIFSYSGPSGILGSDGENRIPL